jgi:hypothetical protein
MNAGDENLDPNSNSNEGRKGQGVEYERPVDPGPFQVPNKREL